MNKTFGKYDLIWGYAGYLAEIAVYALLTPVLTIFLNSFELGLWYTFMSIYSFLNLFDGAFSPIVTRNASYCMSGAKKLVKNGLPELTEGKEPNYGLLAALYKANRKLLLVLSSVILILLFVAGIPYVTFITRDAFEQRFIISWIIFAIGISLNLYTTGVPSFLKGMGYIASAQKCIVIGRSLQLIICLGSVFLGYGILGLSIGILCGALTINILSHYYIKRKIIRFFPKKQEYVIKEVLHAIWHNSKKLLIAAIGSFGISQVNTLLCSTFISLELTASYGLTNQAFQAVAIISFVWMQTATPAISVAKASGNIEQQRKLFSVACVVQYLFGILGAVIVIILANPALRFLGAKTLLLSAPIILIPAFNAFLEKHISLYSNYIMCGNRVPYVKASILSGVAVCGLSTLSLVFTEWGILGLLLSQTVVQLSYNAWKWCYVACKELNIGWLSLLKAGCKNLLPAVKGMIK